MDQHMNQIMNHYGRQTACTAALTERHSDTVRGHYYTTSTTTMSITQKTGVAVLTS